MKSLMLSLFVLVLSQSVFAQRGPRYNPPGGRSGSVYRTAPAARIPNYGYSTPSYGYSGPVVVGPRYNPPGSRRVIRTVVRPPVYWSNNFGYACGSWGELYLNNSEIHNFYFSSDCQQAISDLRIYGDFCDGSDMYNQYGQLEGQFSFSSECRQALSYYY